jgi:thiamine biosynthesis lipoprotein
MAAELRFPSMGSAAHVIVTGGRPGLAEQARWRLDELERRWSRFLPDSEVTALNQLAGRPHVVSADTRLLVRRACDGYRMTGGLFDPTVLGAVEAAGYDRSFERISLHCGPTLSTLRRGADGIEIDDRAGTVRLPFGVGFDPGGIGKGLAADLVVDELLASGAAGACVNVGGDLRAAGAAPDGGAWRIAVEDPRGGSPFGPVVLTDGAVATTSRVKRRWTRADGLDLHHVIDPATGTSVQTAALTATVVAADGWRAEVFAKAAFVAPRRLGLDLVEQAGAAGLIVEERASYVTTTWADFVNPENVEVNA